LNCSSFSHYAFCWYLFCLNWFYFSFENSKEKLFLYEILYLICYGVQRIPLLVLAFAIVLSRGASTEGPSKRSKSILFCATVLNLLTDLPLATWSFIFSLAGWNECYLTIASLVDIVNGGYIVSMILYFVFMRMEYQRNMEECIWSHVSQIQVVI
jgi:hypothetical protein